MNTNPDDTTLALWLEDELDAGQQAVIEQWAEENPTWLLRREQCRAWKAQLQTAIPQSLEPPFSGLFNEKIKLAIQESPSQIQKLKALVLPLSSVAAIILAFFLGQFSSSPSSQEIQSLPLISQTQISNQLKSTPEPYIYTPDSQIAATWATSPNSKSSVIVIEGLKAIPDEVDLVPDNSQGSLFSNYLITQN